MSVGTHIYKPACNRTPPPLLKTARSKCCQPRCIGHKNRPLLLSLRVAVLLAALACFLLPARSAWALKCFMLSLDKGLYGNARWVQVREKDTLLDIARDLGLGYNQITTANPGIDPWVPPQESLVLTPCAFVLPKKRPDAGIVVNLAEMRLYYFFSNGGHDYFLTAPIGVGKEGFLTQLGTYKVKSKTPNPTWFVPESIRQEDPQLPAQVPPGPENPLGDYVLRLSAGLYAIHGTNKPWGIGRRVSHGCIRMYPEDIAALYPLVAVGATVQVIYEPIKFGWADGKCWIQVFEDFDQRVENPLSTVMAELVYYKSAAGPVEIDFKALFRALKEKNGVPTIVAELITK